MFLYQRLCSHCETSLDNLAHYSYKYFQIFITRPPFSFPFPLWVQYSFVWPLHVGIYFYLWIILCRDMLILNEFCLREFITGISFENIELCSLWWMRVAHWSYWNIWLRSEYIYSAIITQVWFDAVAFFLKFMSLLLYAGHFWFDIIER